jgi:hypothetical protein
MSELTFKIGPREARSFVEGIIASLGQFSVVIVGPLFFYGLSEFIIFVAPIIEPHRQLTPSHTIRAASIAINCVLALGMAAFYFAKIVPQVAFHKFQLTDNGIKIFNSSDGVNLKEILYSQIERVDVGRNINRFFKYNTNCPFKISLVYRRSAEESLATVVVLGPKSADEVETIISVLKAKKAGLHVLGIDWKKVGA